MKAWEAYMATPEYANSRKWALLAKSGEQNERDVDGSLWAAFVEGRNSVAQSESERIPESAQILALAHALRRARMHIANRGAFCGHEDMLRFLEETLRPYDNQKDPT